MSSNRVLVAYGTRPELIKLSPVIRALRRRPGIATSSMETGQHKELIDPIARAPGAGDCRLEAMQSGAKLAPLLSRLLALADPVLASQQPRVVLVQGDTATALALALAAFYCRTPVVHVEAGLRTGIPDDPYPEEANRRMISALATLHCAPTERNAECLTAEGIPRSRIEVTGNPVVDALRAMTTDDSPSATVSGVLEKLGKRRLLVVTIHRRENHGPRIEGYLTALRDFVRSRADLMLALPVHANPAAAEPVRRILGGDPRFELLPPLAHCDFIALLQRSWLIASDSGGIHEEAAEFSKPLLILRRCTERPEVIESGLARLAPDPASLAQELQWASEPGAWCTRLTPVPNPFGDGRSAERIADLVERLVLAGGMDHGQSAG